MFVYLVTNITNGKRYAGQHSGNNLNRYWKSCICAALGGSKSKPALYNSVRKHGSENFIIEPLIIVHKKEEMNFYESFLIREFDLRNSEKGYNLTDGGEGTPGRKMSEENRIKLSERMKGKKYGLGHKMTEENKVKLLAVHIGMKHTEEACRKISEGHKGLPQHENTKRALASVLKGNSWNVEKHLSEETKRKLSEAGKGRKHSPESIEKMRLVQKNAPWKQRKLSE